MGRDKGWCWQVEERITGQIRLATVCHTTLVYLLSGMSSVQSTLQWSASWRVQIRSMVIDAGEALSPPVYTEKFLQKYFLFSLLFNQYEFQSPHLEINSKSWKQTFFFLFRFRQVLKFDSHLFILPSQCEPLHSGALKHKKYFNTENICENIFIWKFSSSGNKAAYKFNN